MDRRPADAAAAEPGALEALPVLELQAKLQECYDIEERRRLRAAIRNVKMRTLEPTESVPLEVVQGRPDPDNKLASDENKKGNVADLHLIDSEDRLRDLLYSTSDYDEKKQIRAAIRELRRKKESSAAGAATAAVVEADPSHASTSGGGSGSSAALSAADPQAPLACSENQAEIRRIASVRTIDDAAQLEPEPAEAELCGKGRQRPERLPQKEAHTTDELKKNHQRERYDHKMNGALLHNGDGQDSHGQAPKVIHQLQDIHAMDGSQAVVLSLSFCPDSCVPNVSWYKDGELLAASEDFEQIVDETSCRLVIKELFPDDGGSYKCVIRNKFGEAESSAHLIVEDNPSFKPPEFVVVPRDNTVEAGKSLEVHVEVQGSPEPGLSWFKGNALLQDGKEYRQTLNAGMGTLLVYKVLPDDSGVYKCLASNAAGECEACFGVRVLAPHVPNYSVPRLSAVLEDLTVPDGSSRVTMSCALETRVAFATVSWYRGSKKLRNSKDFQQTFDGSTATLVIHEIYPDDAGIYKCVLAVGNTELTTEATLTVMAGSSAEESCGDSDADDVLYVKSTSDKAAASFAVASTRPVLASVIGCSAVSSAASALAPAGKLTAGNDSAAEVSAASAEGHPLVGTQRESGHTSASAPVGSSGATSRSAAAAGAHVTAKPSDDPVVPRTAPAVESSAAPPSRRQGEPADEAASSNSASTTSAEPARANGLPEADAAKAAEMPSSTAIAASTTVASVPAKGAAALSVPPSAQPLSLGRRAEPGGAKSATPASADRNGCRGSATFGKSRDSSSTAVASGSASAGASLLSAAEQAGSSAAAGDGCRASDVEPPSSGHRNPSEAYTAPVGRDAPASAAAAAGEPGASSAGEKHAGADTKAAFLRAGSSASSGSTQTADRTSHVKSDAATGVAGDRAGRSASHGSTNGVSAKAARSGQALGEPADVAAPTKSFAGAATGPSERAANGLFQPALRSVTASASTRSDRPGAPAAASADLQSWSAGLRRVGSQSTVATPLGGGSVSAKAELYRKAERDSAAPLPRPFVSTKLVSASLTSLAPADLDKPAADAAGGRLSPSPKAPGSPHVSGRVSPLAKDGTVPAAAGRASPLPTEQQQQLQNGRSSPAQPCDLKDGVTLESSSSGSSGGGGCKTVGKCGSASSAPGLAPAPPRASVPAAAASSDGAAEKLFGGGATVDGSTHGALRNGTVSSRFGWQAAAKPEAGATAAASLSSHAPVASSAASEAQSGPILPEKADANNNYASITDENELQKILDKTDDFDERRKIRARIREVKELRKAERDGEWRRREEERVAQEKKRQAEAELSKKEKLERYRDLSKSSIGALPLASDEMAKHKIGEADQEKKRLMEASHALSTTTTLAGLGSRADEALKLKTEAAEKSKEAALKSYENVAKRESESRKDQSKSSGSVAPVSLKPLDKKPAAASAPAASKPAGGKAAPATGKQALAAFKQMDKANNPNAGQSKPKFGGDSKLMQVADALLRWSRYMTKGYEHISIENYTTSWNDGMAFCALIHHFYPDAFDYNSLDPKNRRHNFTLAFETAEKRAGISALLDVEDMVRMLKPDWKCVLTYIQTFYSRIKELEDAKAPTPAGSVSAEAGSD